MLQYPSHYPKIFPLEQDMERAESRRVSLLRAPSYFKRAGIYLEQFTIKATSKYLKKTDMECDLAASPFAEIKTKLAFANAAAATSYGFEWFATLTGFKRCRNFKLALETGFRHLHQIQKSLPFSALIRLEIKHVRHTDYTPSTLIKEQYYEPHFHLAIVDAEKKEIQKALKKFPTEIVVRPLVLRRIETIAENARVMNYIAKGVQAHSQLKIKKREEVKTFTYEGPSKITVGFYETSVLLHMGLKYWDFFATTKDLVFSPTKGFFYGNKDLYLNALARQTKNRLKLVIEYLDNQNKDHDACLPNPRIMIYDPEYYWDRFYHYLNVKNNPPKNIVL